jgi:asparaginyl-tRNA synthetase
LKTISNAFPTLKQLILRDCTPNKKEKFNYIINEWGADLQSARTLFSGKHFKCPVILFDYPANIKAFYMRLNEDGKTVRAMDILFPGIEKLWRITKRRAF